MLLVDVGRKKLSRIVKLHFNRPHIPKGHSLILRIEMVSNAVEVLSYSIPP